MITNLGKQLTVVWHVDNLMGSCMDNFELTKFLCYLGRIYGPKFSMHTGKKHEYLRMDMEFNDNGTLGMSMIMYLKNVIEGFLEEIKGKAARPAANHLFTVRDKKETRVLEKERALVFHHMVAQLLFVCTRARQDIQAAVVFLTTRVKEPDKDDWGKLKRVLKYLKGTKYLMLKLSVDNLGILKWFEDRSHNIHMDCSRHSGALFSMGKGAILSYSKKVKMNTRSSKETELMTTNMFMPEMLWSVYFIQVQGYDVECVGLYQDDVSMQLLIKNGWMSTGRKTKHTKAKFSRIKDRVDNREIKGYRLPHGRVVGRCVDDTFTRNGI
jgi:hypothetical protein